MKLRAKWLNDILLSTKPGRHENKKRKQEEKRASEEAREIRAYRQKRRQLLQDEDY